jgi:hypothetical protein
MSSRRTIFRLGLLLVHGACATPQPRCSEYQQAISILHAEISASQTGKISGTREALPLFELSEEGALLSKRLKTLCELVWEERISYRVYQTEVRRAYHDYHHTRIRGSMRRLP